MNKLKMHSPDTTQSNILRLREIFPGCVTEAGVGVAGETRYEVDFHLLRQELSDNVVDGPKERYGLDWPGKRAAVALANSKIAKTLRPSRSGSVKFDETKNLFIEGDNLDALKILQSTLLGRVKLIYIDPPYNTGGDFIYKDDYQESAESYFERSNQSSESGEWLVANREGGGRFHSHWLSMLYPRLKIARSLLADDGAIFVSIDFNEVANLRHLMDEIFGEENFQRQIVWRIGWLSGFKTNTPNFIRNHDVILFYSKNAAKFSFNKKYIENKDFKKLVKDDKKFKDKMRKLGLNRQQQKDLLNFINHENRPAKYPIEDTWNCNEYDDLNSIAIVSFSSEKISKILEIEQEFKGQKSIQLLKRILLSSTSSDDLVLDFFAGTASTAHAALQLNSEDGGNRRYIMIQLPEPTNSDDMSVNKKYPTIADIAMERLRRVGRKIASGGGLHPGWRRDTGFRVFKVDTSNLEDFSYYPHELEQRKLPGMREKVKADRSDEDLLFQVLLDWDLDITLPINVKRILGKKVFFVGEDELAACFDPAITKALVEKLARKTPPPARFVFLEDGNATDKMRVAIREVFREYSPTTRIGIL